MFDLPSACIDVLLDCRRDYAANPQSIRRLRHIEASAIANVNYSVGLLEKC